MGVTNFDNLKDLVNNPKKPKESKEYPSPTNFDNIKREVPAYPTFKGDGLYGLSSDFGSSQYDDYSNPASTVDQLDRIRAHSQPLSHQLGNMVGQAILGEVIGGTLEGIGYIMDVGSIIDVMQGDEADWGNFMTEFGQSIRKGTEENLRIYQDPNAHGWNKMLDTGWWAQGLVSTASTLSMLVPTAGVMRAASLLGKGLGATRAGVNATRGMRAVRKAVGLAEEMGHKGRWMRDGISQAILSRNIENWMESHGTFEDMKSQKLNEVDNKTGKFYTEEEATRIASEAAASNYKKGWAMLIQDIPQYLAIGRVFNPSTGKFEKALRAGRKSGRKPIAGLEAKGGKKQPIPGLEAKAKPTAKPWKEKAYDASKTFFGEAGEESYQYFISEQSKLKADLDAGYITEEEYNERVLETIGDEEMGTSAFFGGLGGNLFKLAGHGLNKALKGKDQKEYEERLEASFKDLKSRSKQLKSLYQALGTADQEGSKEMRDQVIDESMLNLAVEALEMDKFNEFYETLGLVSDMSEEDANNYKEVTGDDFSRELAKEAAPRLQEMALDVRDRYLKHRNRHSRSTSSRLTLLESHNENLTKKVKKSRDNVSEIKRNMGEQFDMQASDRLKKRLDIRERGQVLKSRKEALAARLKSASETQKPFIQAAIDNNEILLKQQKKDEENQRKETRDRTPEQKEIDKDETVVSQDKAAEKLYNGLHKDRILKELEDEARARDQIIINNEDMAFSKSEEGKSLARKETIRKQIENISKVDKIEEALVELRKLRETSVPNSNIDKKEKEQFYDILDTKIKELEDTIKEDKLLTQDDEDRVDAAFDNMVNNNNPETPNGVDVITDVKDNIEHHESNEIVNSTNDQREVIKEINKLALKKTKMVSILDQILDKDKNSVIPEFDKWLLNPESKLDETFSYTADVTNTFADQDAIKAFNDLKKKGFKRGDEIPQEIIDSLPIRVSLDKNKKVFSYLTPKPKKEGIDLERYKLGYAEERKVIITKLLLGEKASSTVIYNTGGELTVDYDSENKIVPEYSILDILQFGGDMSKIELLVTNKDGRLIDMDKVQDLELGGKQFFLNNIEGSAKKLYAGGLFLKVKMANGQPFALRLNHKTLTTEQADVLADILLDVGVTSPDIDKEGNVIKGKNGKMKVSKKLQLSMSLKEVEPKLQQRIKDVLGPEINMLDPEYQEPTIQEIIDSLVYMSSRTERKKSALFMDKNDLVFGSNGTKITLANRNNPEIKSKFIEFLTDKSKRRQFSIKMWQESDRYKKFIINNRIINTNATITKQLFQHTRRKDEDGNFTGIRAQIHLKPLRKIENQGVTTNSAGQQTISNAGPGKNTVQKISDDKVVLKEEKFSIHSKEEVKTYVYTVPTNLDGSLGKYLLEIFNFKNELEDIQRNSIFVKNGKPLENGITAEEVLRSRLNDDDVFKKIGERNATDLNTSEVLAQLTDDQKSRLGISTLDTSPTKKNVEADTSDKQVVTYTPSNGIEEEFTISGNKIFNSEGVEVFEGQNIDKNKIFANLSVKTKKSRIVEYLGKRYVVNQNNKIMSVSSGEILVFDEGNQHEKAILGLAQQSNNDENVNAKKARGIIEKRKEIIEKYSYTEDYVPIHTPIKRNSVKKEVAATADSVAVVDAVELDGVQGFNLFMYKQNDTGNFIVVEESTGITVLNTKIKNRKNATTAANLKTKELDFETAIKTITVNNSPILRRQAEINALEVDLTPDQINVLTKMKRLYPDIAIGFTQDGLSFQVGDGKTVMNQQDTSKEPEAIILKDKQKEFEEKLNKKLDQIMKGLNVSVRNNADFLIDRSNFPHAMSAFDALQKIVAFRKDSTSQDKLMQTASILYTFLGSKSKVNKDIWANIDQWSGYRSAYKKHNNGEERGSWEEKNTFAHRLAIIDFIAEQLNKAVLQGGLGTNTSSENVDLDKNYFSERGFRNDIYEKNAIKKLIKKLANFINEVIFRNKRFDDYDERSLTNLVMEVVDDVYKNDFKKFFRVYSKNSSGEVVARKDGAVYEKKNYEKTWAKDKFAHSIFKRLSSNPFIDFKLSGSQTVRKYGDLYRPENEDLHDIDGVITLDTFSKDPLAFPFKLWVAQNKDNRDFSKEAEKKLRGLNWYKNMLQVLPDFQFETAFVGKDHKNSESLTITGYVNHATQKDENGNPKKVVLDFFLRMAEGNYPEIYDNYWKDWKQIFEAKLNMGRAKDINDLLFFVPFKTDINKFTNKGFRFFTFGEGKKVLDENKFEAKVNRGLENDFGYKNQVDRYGNIKGQANIDAMTVLFDKNRMSDDTIYHEYAHHYIAWNRNAPIVQAAIAKYNDKDGKNGEERLVQAIGEQAAEQGGEARNWFIKFIEWLKKEVSQLTSLNSTQIKNVLTDAFLNAEASEQLGLVNKKPVTEDNSDKVEVLEKELDSLDLDPFNNTNFKKDNERRLEILNEIKALEKGTTINKVGLNNKKGTINVYWGQAESKESTKVLSNLSPREFVYGGKEYMSVEHAYQVNKSGTFDKVTDSKYRQMMMQYTPMSLKAFSSKDLKIRGKGTVAEMKAADSLGLMKKLVVESFKQNPNSEAAKKLMQYENFTHNTNQLIDQAFLEGLKLAQQELSKSTQQTGSSFELNGRVFNIKPNHHPEVKSIIEKLSGNPTGLRKVESSDPNNKTRYYVDNNNNRFIGMSSIVNPSDFGEKRKDESQAEYNKRMQMWSGAAPIGQAVDEVLRSFFDGGTPVYEGEVAKRMTKKSFDNLIVEAKQFKKNTENSFGKDNVEFLTKGLFVSNKTVTASQKHVNKAVSLEKDRSMNYGIATEMDMVIVDKKTGLAHLVDFKTQRAEVGQDPFKKLETRYASKTEPGVSKSKVDGYSKQQNASRLILEKETGVNLETMSLLVVATRYNAFGQQSSTANLKQKTISLEKENIENVFPENYRKQILGNESQVSDTDNRDNNTDSVPLQDTTSVSDNYYIDESAPYDLDNNGIEDDGYSFDDNKNLDYTGSASSNLRNYDGKKGDVKCSGNK
jgi:hypothetical protein